MNCAYRILERGRWHHCILKRTCSQSKNACVCFPLLTIDGEKKPSTFSKKTFACVPGFVPRTVLASARERRSLYKKRCFLVASLPVATRARENGWSGDAGSRYHSIRSLLWVDWLVWLFPGPLEKFIFERARRSRAFCPAFSKMGKNS